MAIPYEHRGLLGKSSNKTRGIFHYLLDVPLKNCSFRSTKYVNIFQSHSIYIYIIYIYDTLYLLACNIYIYMCVCVWYVTSLHVFTKPQPTPSIKCSSEGRFVSSFAACINMLPFHALDELRVEGPMNLFEFCQISHSHLSAGPLKSGIS